MSLDEIQAYAQIAQSLTVAGVLLWVSIREARRGDNAIGLIVDDWKDLTRERTAKKPQNLPNPPD